ncbi:UNKNOWN [Stylonychia lemnae]|uniref:Uncharacterized protein n=1 Tax=Stylonychia lemnae TaxID=5949 RepID=A0A078B0X2_STYLE|nr:UNKNOWN [Stylonychia lemnae]|eukprot:CDW87971.1 UNKNOWN [Stylonychia lemnae]
MQYRDAACLTVLANIQKPLAFVIDKAQTPKFLKETQTVLEIQDKGIQSDPPKQTKDVNDQFIQVELIVQNEAQQNYLQRSLNNFGKLDNSGSGFFVTSNPLSNRNELNSTNAKNTSELKTNDEISYIQSHENTAKRFNRNDFLEKTKSGKAGEFQEYQDSASNNQLRQFEEFDDSNLKSENNDQQNKKAKSQATSRIASAKRMAHLYSEGLNDKLDILLAQKVDEQGNLIVFDSESGRKYKVLYSDYLRSLNYQMNTDKSRSSFKYQEQDENVYKRLWNDINNRAERSQAASEYLQEQRINQLEKAAKLGDNSNYGHRNIVNYSQRSNSMSHQLEDALVMLNSINGNKDSQKVLPITEENQEFNLKPRIKKDKKKFNVNNKQQLCKVIPYNLQIMSNILGKVYIEKQDKCIQVDENNRDDSYDQNDRLQENYRNLKKMKQKRIKHGRLLSTNFNSNFDTSSTAYPYGAQNHLKQLRKKIGFTQNDRRNASSGEILNIKSSSSNQQLISQSDQQPIDLQINPMVMFNNVKLKPSSPKSRDHSIQVLWKEQDPQIYEFSLNSPEVRHINRGINNQLSRRIPREIHSAKKSKSRLLAAKQSKLSNNTSGYDNDMLPIHSKESFVIQLIQKNKGTASTNLLGLNQKQRNMPNNRSKQDLSIN